QRQEGLKAIFNSRQLQVMYVFHFGTIQQLQQLTESLRFGNIVCTFASIAVST
ncbi:hypothetical protein BgiBS90_033324, partial [Biomphalaria glabrata]